MTPRLSSEYGANGGLFYAVFFGQPRLPIFPTGAAHILTSNRFNNVGCNFGCNAHLSALRLKPSLGSSISSVITFGSGDDMPRRNTGGIVADVHSAGLRPVAIGEVESDPMYQVNRTLEPHGSIAEFIFAERPQEARI